MPSIPLFRQCPPDEPGAPCINDWIYAASCALKRANVDQARAADTLRTAMTRKEKFPREIDRQVERAYGVASLPCTTTRKTDTELFNPDLLIERASQIDFAVMPDWLRARSPHALTVTPTQFLDALFEPSERVMVMRSYGDAGFPYQPCNADHAERLERVLKHNEKGAWFICNPTDGRGKKGENITDWRYCLLESDEEDYGQCWLRMLVQEPLRIVALTESGNTSIHALIRINATCRIEFDSVTKSLAETYGPLGACIKSLTTDERLTRLSNVTRGDNQRSQRLLYLNPSADATPILHREAFEPLF
jgi:hypothetical protein